MSSKLNQALGSLRAVIPSVNAAADEANRIVKQVERVLADELGVGISARSSRCFESRRRDIEVETGAATAERIEEFLAFGRVHGAYCIHRLIIIYHQGEFGILADEVDSEATPWGQCDRETRLQLFDLLPELIENIVTRAKQLAEKGRATSLKVKELLEEEDRTKPSGASSVVKPVKTESARSNPADRVGSEQEKFSERSTSSQRKRRRLNS
jgi:hypothetical protein